MPPKRRLGRYCGICDKKIKVKNQKHLRDEDTGAVYHFSCFKREYGDDVPILLPSENPNGEFGEGEFHVDEDRWEEEKGQTCPECLEPMDYDKDTETYECPTCGVRFGVEDLQEEENPRGKNGDTDSGECIVECIREPRGEHGLEGYLRGQRYRCVIGDGEARIYIDSDMSSPDDCCTVTMGVFRKYFRTMACNPGAGEAALAVAKPLAIAGAKYAAKELQTEEGRAAAKVMLSRGNPAEVVWSSRDGRWVVEKMDERQYLVVEKPFAGEDAETQRTARSMGEDACVYPQSFKTASGAIKKAKMFARENPADRGRTDVDVGVPGVGGVKVGSTWMTPEEMGAWRTERRALGEDVEGGMERGLRMRKRLTEEMGRENVGPADERLYPACRPPGKLPVNIRLVDVCRGDLIELKGERNLPFGVVIHIGGGESRRDCVSISSGRGAPKGEFRIFADWRKTKEEALRAFKELNDVETEFIVDPFDFDTYAWIIETDAIEVVLHEQMVEHPLVRVSEDFKSWVRRGRENPGNIKPWGGTCPDCGQNSHAYPHVGDIRNFMKRKRSVQYVILCDALMPIKCAVCGKMINKGEANLTDIYPRSGKVSPKHYACAWGATLDDVLKVGRANPRSVGDLIKLFVYGEHLNAGYIRGFEIIDKKPAVAHGEMRALGYAAVRFENGDVIKGLVLTLRSEIPYALEFFDADKGASGYDRIETAVTMNDGNKERVWSYDFKRDEPWDYLWKKASIVKNGDWIAYLNRNENPRSLKDIRSAIQGNVEMLRAYFLDIEKALDRGDFTEADAFFRFAETSFVRIMTLNANALTTEEQDNAMIRGLERDFNRYRNLIHSARGTQHEKAVAGLGRHPTYKNPHRPTKEFWDKHFYPIQKFYREKGYDLREAEEVARRTTGHIWYHRMGSKAWAKYEKIRRAREGRAKRRRSRANPQRGRTTAVVDEEVLDDLISQMKKGGFEVTQDKGAAVVEARDSAGKVVFRGIQGEHEAWILRWKPGMFVPEESDKNPPDLLGDYADECHGGEENPKASKYLITSGGAFYGDFAPGASGRHEFQPKEYRNRSQAIEHAKRLHESMGSPVAVLAVHGPSLKEHKMVFSMPVENPEYIGDVAGSKVVKGSQRAVERKAQKLMQKGYDVVITPAGKDGRWRVSWGTGAVENPKHIFAGITGFRIAEHMSADDRPTPYYRVEEMVSPPTRNHPNGLWITYPECYSTIADATNAIKTRAENPCPPRTYDDLIREEKNDPQQVFNKTIRCPDCGIGLENGGCPQGHIRANPGWANNADKVAFDAFIGQRSHLQKGVVWNDLAGAGRFRDYPPEFLKAEFENRWGHVVLAANNNPPQSVDDALGHWDAYMGKQNPHKPTPEQVGKGVDVGAKIAGGALTGATVGSAIPGVGTAVGAAAGAGAVAAKEGYTAYKEHKAKKASAPGAPTGATPNPGEGVVMEKVGFETQQAARDWARDNGMVVMDCTYDSISNSFRLAYRRSESVTPPSALLVAKELVEHGA